MTLSPEEQSEFARRLDAAETSIARMSGTVDELLQMVRAMVDRKQEDSSLPIEAPKDY